MLADGTQGEVGMLANGRAGGSGSARESGYRHYDRYLGDHASSVSLSPLSQAELEQGAMKAQAAPDAAYFTTQRRRNPFFKEAMKKAPAPPVTTALMAPKVSMQGLAPIRPSLTTEEVPILAPAPPPAATEEAPMAPNEVSMQALVPASSSAASPKASDATSLEDQAKLSSTDDLAW